MYAEFFSKSPLLALPLVALLVFVTVFAIAVARTFTRRGREHAKAAALLVFDGEPVPVSPTHNAAPPVRTMFNDDERQS